MTKIKEGILGPVSGKIGPVVGGTWKGIPYLRLAPKKDGKKRKRTVGQIANQEKFNYVNQLLVPFHPYITIGFKHEAEHKTEISAAFSVNFNRAIIGVFPNLSVDYSKLVLSVGKLPGLTDVVMERIDPGVLKLSWTKDDCKYAIFNDQIILVAYCPELKKVDGFVGGVKRTEKECILKLEPKLRGKILEVYVIVSSVDQKKIANSQYLGSINMM